MKASNKLMSLFLLQPHTGTHRATSNEAFTLPSRCSHNCPPAWTPRHTEAGEQRDGEAVAGRRLEGCPALLSSPANALGGVSADPGSKNPESLCLRCKGSAVPCGERLVGNAQHGVSQTDKTRRDQEQTGHVPAWTRALPGGFLDVLRVSYL